MITMTFLLSIMQTPPDNISFGFGQVPWEIQRFFDKDLHLRRNFPVPLRRDNLDCNPVRGFREEFPYIVRQDTGVCNDADILFSPQKEIEKALPDIFDAIYVPYQFLAACPALIRSW